MTKRKGLLAIIMTLLVMFLAGCNFDIEADVEETIENGGAYKEEVSVDKDKITKEDEVIEVDKSEVDGIEQEDKTLEVDELEEVAESKDEGEKDNLESLKILSTHKMEAETINFKSDLDAIINKVHDVGGYISSNSIKSGDPSRKQLTESKLTLRVPRGSVNEMIEAINDNILITSETLTSADITDKYYDIEARIENLENRENRLRELYDKSEDVNDIITIDDKLFEVTKDKEEMIREKLRMEDRVSLSRIDINIKEVRKLSIDNSDDLSSKEKISLSFHSTGSRIKNISVGVLVLLVKVFPALLVAGGIFYVYRRVFKSNEKDNEQVDDNETIKEVNENVDKKDEV